MELDRERGCGELGYWIAAAARGRGAARRAVALLRDWAHAELGLSELEILANRDNRPSQLVAERAGFDGHRRAPLGRADAGADPARLQGLRLAGGRDDPRTPAGPPAG